LKTSFVVVFAVVFLFHSSGQVLHHIAAANIAVVQNDTNNTSASVTVSTALSINDFRIRTGSNRGDYDVQVGPVSADDVTNGILMTSIRQNGRDNGEAKYPGMNYGTCGVDSSGTPPGASGEWFIPLFQAPTGDEYNFNVAAAWFPYSDGWYGGWLNNASGANGGANNHLIGTPGLVLGTHVVDQGSGKTKVDLRAFGLDSRSNAVLLVEGGKNESNFALSTTNSDGTWTVYCHDDDVSGGSYEQDYVGFVCVPLTNHTVVSGKFLGDNTVLMSSQTYNVSNPGLGAYHLSIPGVDPNTGVLIISAEGAGSLNLDNIVSYEVNGDGWDIQTRDLNPGYTPLVQNLDVSNAVVSFVFVPGPAASTRLLWSGNSSTNWDYSANQVWRLASNGALTNYSDAAQIVFDDSASNTIVNVATTVTPYQVTVSNASRAYVMGGSGKVSGGASFTKLGGAKLTLAVANSYTGDTTISQGTAAQGTNNSVPGGGGFGDTTIMGTFDLAGFDCTINNFSGHGVVDNTAAGKSPRLTAYQTATTTYGGILKNTSGSLAFGVSGGGKLTLTGANTFGGGVIISDGTLLVNGSLGAGPVSVLSGGQFGGTGSTLASVSITNNGALLLTANSPLTTGPISLNGTATINISGAGSLTTAGTYALLNHGAVSGGGSFKLGPIPGLQPNGLAAKLWDTGSQLQLILTVAGVTGTIADVRHVVILMDENRAFDH
jgi:autotransporter-associated beta strand protein